MVEVFREVRRVLRADGTLWLNLGDSYAVTHHGKGGNSKSEKFNDPGDAWRENVVNERRELGIPSGLKPKDLVGIPWRVAFALQADGWWLRSDIIWSKPNPMPESVTDRPTKAHEYLFLLTSPRGTSTTRTRCGRSAEYGAVRDANDVAGTMRRVGGAPRKSGAGDRDLDRMRTLARAATSAPSGPSQRSPSRRPTSRPSPRSWSSRVSRRERPRRAAARRAGRGGCG